MRDTFALRGRTFLDGRLVTVTVAWSGSRIARVGASRSAKVDLDVGDRLVLPGYVDSHVHFRDPGHPAKEDFASGTASAAFGGVTTVLDMPNTDPPATTAKALAAKRALVAPKAHVDFGLFAGLADDRSLDALPDACGLKVYLGASTGNLLVEDMALVARAMSAARKAGRTVAFHAESEACLRRHAQVRRPSMAAAAGTTRQHAAAKDAEDFEAHYWSRPNVCEKEAVEAVAKLGGPFHVCHLSTADGLAALPDRASAEVAPHHLFFTKDDLARGGAFKMNPPLRLKADRERLLDALARGRVHLASDHAPHTPEEKGRDVWECPSGVPGVETMGPLALALALAHPEKVPLARVVDALTSMPARAFGLSRKGSLAPGMEADVVVVDPAKVQPIVADRLHSRAGWTPFEGLPAVFPDSVWVRGQPVVADGTLVGKAGHGRLVEAPPRVERV